MNVFNLVRVCHKAINILYAIWSRVEILCTDGQYETGARREAFIYIYTIYYILYIIGGESVTSSSSSESSVA